jgi:heme/copper-type cytochrome/quinol oxidase subunit 2
MNIGIGLTELSDVRLHTAFNGRSPPFLSGRSALPNRRGPATVVQPGAGVLMYTRRYFLFAGFMLAASRVAGRDRRDQRPSAQRFSVAARRYAFEPRRIDVEQDDLVQIELRTLDIAHSLTIDGYRIAKRVSPDAPVNFEFRASQAGTFPFYCNIKTDEGCGQMRGELIVRPRR